MADRQVEVFASNSSSSTTASDTTSFAYGPSGSLIGNITSELDRRVRFQTPIVSTDVITVEVSSDRVIWHTLSAQINPFAGTNISALRYENGVTYGLGLSNIVSSTDVTIKFGQYQFNASTYGAVGQAWSVGSGSGYWRVRKVSGGASVGYPIAPGNIALMNTQDNYSGNTKMGLMSYSHGTTYNGGNAPTVSYIAGGGTATINRCVFVPYQMADGTWRLKFNIDTSLSSANRTTMTLQINGVVSAASTQAVTGFVTGTAVPPRAIFTASSNQITFDLASSLIDSLRVSGDVELASKPSWAY
jgi:hypothetical protein